MVGSFLIDQINLSANLATKVRLFGSHEPVVQFKRKMKLLVCVLVCFLASAVADEQHPRKARTITPKAVVNVMEGSRTFWTQRAQSYVQSKLNSKLNTNKAKNVIFFIGDGMSIATVAAARMYTGKEENELSFEQFPHYGLAQTYCVDKQVADSACSAVAFLAGVKTNNRLLGLNANVLSRQCVVNEADHVDSIIAWAQNSKKATGIVTTTRITHATPGGAYAHVAHRDWENNGAISSACRNTPGVTDIAHQMVYNKEAMNLKVILGGGRRHFRNSTVYDEEGYLGARTDGRDLINEWLEERNKQGTAKYVSHKQQLDEIDIHSTDFLLGLFEDDHCLYHLDVLNDHLAHQEPSLTDMTVKALKMLQKEENGYFLFVEGGRIDHAHHGTRPQRALEETKELARAVDMVRKMTDVEDTLIVVSADHSHVMTYNGYPDRGTNILGLAEVSLEDGLPYQTLSYSNGPGYATTFEGDTNTRVNLLNVDLKNPSHRPAATVPLSSESHAGEDVSVYASGPWSHLFVGSYEQNIIPLAMAYAAQIGPYDIEPTQVEDSTTPSLPTTTVAQTTTDAAGLKTVSVILMAFSFVIRFLIQ